MILLIGADSGLTMEMMRLADTIFPNPMLISLMAILVLLAYAGSPGLIRDYMPAGKNVGK
ncbi:hypothetical protein D3C75_1199790 [compost metagenome]